MMDLVHIFCVVVLSATIKSASAMELDLLMITKNSLLKTLDLSTAIVKSDYQRAQANLNMLDSQIQLQSLQQSPLSINEGQKTPLQIPPTDCYEFLRNRTRKSPVIECSKENYAALDAALAKALAQLEAREESAERCIANEPNTAVVTGNMIAAGCVKRIEWSLPNIVDVAKAEFLTAVCGCYSS